MSTPIYAPYSQSYATREAYVTSAEFNAAGTGVNTSQIVPGAGTEVNADALAEILNDASSWADDICFQILAATMEVESGTYAVIDEALTIPLPQFPIFAVYGMTVGDSVADATGITDFTGLQIDKNTITLPSTAFNCAGPNVYATVTYVAGFANSLTTSASTLGSQTLDIDGTLGMAPGMTMQIRDPGSSEAIVIESITGNVVTTVSPMRFAHGIGISVSSLPPVIKRAVILLATVLAKNRASQAIQLETTTTTPRQKSAQSQSGAAEEVQATKMLSNFVRTF